MELTNSFSAPAFDDSLVVPQWIQFNGQNSPNHPIFVYSLWQSTEIQIITWGEFALAVKVAANLVRSRIDKNIITQPPVIAILGNLGVVSLLHLSEPYF
jgi:hypothetical protein